MSNNTRFKIARLVLFTSIFVLGCAVWAVESSNLIPALIIIVISLVAGVIAAPNYYMYKEYRRTNKTKEQIARETLKKLNTNK